MSWNHFLGSTANDQELHPCLHWSHSNSVRLRFAFHFFSCPEHREFSSFYGSITATGLYACSIVIFTLLLKSSFIQLKSVLFLKGCQGPQTRQDLQAFQDQHFRLALQAPPNWWDYHPRLHICFHRHHLRPTPQLPLILMVYLLHLCLLQKYWILALPFQSEPL